MFKYRNYFVQQKPASTTKRDTSFINILYIYNFYLCRSLVSKGERLSSVIYSFINLPNEPELADLPLIQPKVSWSDHYRHVTPGGADATGRVTG